MTEHDFWSFSLRVYSRPKVERIFLELQTRWQLNVNMLLYCCWLAETGQPAVSTDQIHRLMQQISEWQQSVVQPLRGLRMRVKPLAQGNTQGDALYAQLKRAELQAERIEQNVLQAHSNFDEQGARLGIHIQKQQAEKNISAYLQVLDVEKGTTLRKHIVQLLDVVYG